MTVQSAVDAILPLGKVPLVAGQTAPELATVHKLALIDWAVDEALQAGATRLILVAPDGYGPAAAIAGRVRHRVANRPLREGAIPAGVVLLHHGCTGPEGWDGMIRAAASLCETPHAVLIDPMILLMSGKQVVTLTAFMLRRDHAESGMDQPLLVAAKLPWDDALHWPVISRAGVNPALTYDRPDDELLVFAGRAILALPLPAPEGDGASPWPVPYRFAYETLTRLLLRQGATIFGLSFEPVDAAAGSARMQALRKGRDAQLPAPLQLTARVGLAALQQAV